MAHSFTALRRGVGSERPRARRDGLQAEGDDRLDQGRGVGIALLRPHVGRERADQALVQRAHDAGGSGARVLLRRKLAAPDAVLDHRFEDVGEGAVIDKALRIDLGFGGLGHHGVGKPRDGERPPREHADRVGEPRRRRTVALSHGRDHLDLVAGIERQRLGEQLALGGKVAIDGAGRDVRGLGDQADLRAAKADVSHDGAHRLKDAVALVEKLLLDALGTTISHDVNPDSLHGLRNEPKFTSCQCRL